MTMHLEGPWLSTTGKKKGKQKFRNADEARKARELDASWKELQAKWGVEAETKRKNRAMTAPLLSTPKPFVRDTGPRIPSKNSSDMSPATKPETKIYTGTKMKGIGTMHKSNSVPIFSDEEAVAIATMRR